MALILLAGVASKACIAESLQLHESDIKAGLLYNFLKYVEWPPEKMAGQPATIAVCIFGQDPFGGRLRPLESMTVQKRAISIRYIQGARDALSCHLLFVNASEKAAWPALAGYLTGKNVLTVSDFAGFAEAGGMIEFNNKRDHVGVDLNVTALEAARLRVQDRLLRLVTVVHYPPQSGGRAN